MKRINHLEGLIAAPFTPMKKDGSLNLPLIPEYYRFLKRNKIAGAFINGSTGEGASLSMREKMQLTEAWAECINDDRDFKLITLVGGTCIADCIELAQHAAHAGVYAVAFTAPFYFKPADARQLAKCCMEVGARVPEMPFYYYHIPVLNGTNLPMIDLIRELDERMENFAGIKYTHEDLMDYHSCLGFKGGKYDLLWGRDETMLSALVLGARGAVGSTFNYAAPLYHQLMTAFRKNELEAARSHQLRAIEMIRLLGKYGGITTGKAYMKLAGLDCGEFRLPVQNLTNAQFDIFKKDTDGIGFGLFRSV